MALSRFRNTFAHCVIRGCEGGGGGPGLCRTGRSPGRLLLASCPSIAVSERNVSRDDVANDELVDTARGRQIYCNLRRGTENRTCQAPVCEIREYI